MAGSTNLFFVATNGTLNSSGVTSWILVWQNVISTKMMGEAKNPQISLILANVGAIYTHIINLNVMFLRNCMTFINIFNYSSKNQLITKQNLLTQLGLRRLGPPLHKTIHCTLHSRKIDMSTCITSSVVRRQKWSLNGQNSGWQQICATYISPCGF